MFIQLHPDCHPFQSHSNTPPLTQLLFLLRWSVHGGSMRLTMAPSTAHLQARPWPPAGCQGRREALSLGAFQGPQQDLAEGVLAEGVLGWMGRAGRLN